MYNDQLSTKQMVLDTYKDIANSFLVVKEPQEKDTLSETYLGEYNIEEINNIVQNIVYNETEVKYYDTILQYIETYFTSNYYDTTDLDKGKDHIIKTNKTKIILTTTTN